MEAQIINYRRGRKTQKTNQMIIIVSGYDNKDKSSKLIGKKVIYTCEGKDKKKIIGEVKSVHGSKGALRVLFEKGMPGQAIGSIVEVKD